MENKINIAELLEDCPRGMELYSPIFGEVYLDKIRPHLAIVVTTDKEQGDFKEEFLYDGRYGMKGGCMLFPSKDQRDWSKFHRHFKDGDICYLKTKEIEHIFIFKVSNDDYYIECYATLFGTNLYIDGYPVCDTYCVKEIRLATEEERVNFFDTIKAIGYEWNAETKTLMKLAKPRFRLGDKVVLVSEPEKQYIITGIDQRSDMVYYDATGVNTDSTLSMYSEWRLLPYGEDIREEYIKALATFGAEHQRMMCIEECAELIDALAKYDRGRAEAKDVITELADVSIMVEQMAMLYGKEEFKAEKERKLKRLQKK